MKNPPEVQLPSSSYILVTLRVKKSGDCISLAPFDGLLLNLRHSPAIEGSLVGGLNAYHWSNSRCQLTYGIAHGLAEIAQFLSVHPPVKCSADIGAVQPEIDEIRFVCH